MTISSFANFKIEMFADGASVDGVRAPSLPIHASAASPSTRP